MNAEPSSEVWLKRSSLQQNIFSLGAHNGFDYAVAPGSSSNQDVLTACGQKNPPPQLSLGCFRWRLKWPFTTISHHLFYFYLLYFCWLLYRSDCNVSVHAVRYCSLLYRGLSQTCRGRIPQKTATQGASECPPTLTFLTVGEWSLDFRG